MATSSTVSLRRKLAVSSLCKGLTEAEIDRVFAIAEERTFANDQPLFLEGQLSDSLLVIAQGRVEVTKQKTVLATLSIGDVLGELSLFGGTHMRSATGIAKAPTTVLALPTTGFRKLLVANDLAALKMVSTLAHQMAERMLALTDKLVASNSRAASVIEAKKTVAGWRL